MSQSSTAVYDSTFFTNHLDGAIHSARVIVPLVLELAQPRSILDVGCGVGGWLSVFAENGIEEVRGVDGAYVEVDQLLIPRDRFTALDLSQNLQLPYKADLAVCLEVGEHLPTGQSAELVRALTESAPVVLFSAAVPGQGGTHHINEQWPSFWCQLFESRGFRKLDPIRRHIVHDRRVCWWYRQNVVMYASADALAANPRLRAELELIETVRFEIVNETILGRFMTVRGLCRELARTVVASLKRRLSRVRPARAGQQTISAAARVSETACSSPLS